MRPLDSLRNISLVLVLLGFLALEAEAGRMGEEKTGMMGHERTGTLTGAADHHAAGTIVLTAGDSGAVLTLQEVAVDEVPDGRVYLAKDGDHRKGIEVGKLTRFSGTVSYPLPQGVDTAGYNTVVIWCEKFNVEIGRATLAGKGM